MTTLPRSARFPHRPDTTRKRQKRTSKPAMNPLAVLLKHNKPYYRTALGSAHLGDSLKLMQHIPDDTFDLIVTSPPFALTSKKEYGNEDEDKYVEWFLHFSKEFRRLIKPTGSFVLDLGSAYVPGKPVKSIYQYELLIRLCREQSFYLAQEFFHYNPARLPAPAEWVNVRRIRVKDSVNVVWWLSKTPFPKANNRNILRPYTKAMQDLLANGYTAKRRPSGHDITAKFSKDNKGAIPPNVLEIGNNDSNSDYIKKSYAAGLKPHPARFPRKFAEFFITFLTDEGDLVLDPFAGSNTTGAVAESLNRKWVAMELTQSYLDGSKFRFSEQPNLFGAGAIIHAHPRKK